MSSSIVVRWRVLLLLSVLIAVPPSSGESLSGKDLLTALRAGGCIILMRHASSPPEPPDSTVANADNTQHERQLDEARATTSESPADYGVDDLVVRSFDDGRESPSKTAADRI
jgi:hypothetical protein